MLYEIKNDKIQSEACEISIVYHCNFSCRSCSHLSPRMDRYFVNPDGIFKAMSALSKNYHPKHVRLVGGEPLLHPNLLDVIDAVRDSGISECIRILTNGVLLGCQPDSFWERVDEVHISIYPSYQLSSEKLSICRQIAIAYDVDIQILHFNYFREAYSDLGTTNIDLVRRIYSTCQIAHRWHCHTISDDGYFYMCPQSQFIPKGLKSISSLEMVNDGLRILDSDIFLDELLSYLSSVQPLQSCNYCLGSVGKLFHHERDTNDSKLNATHHTEDLVDWDYLELLEKDPYADNLCVHSSDE